MFMVKKIVRTGLFAILLCVPLLTGAFENVEIALEIGGPAKDTLKSPAAVAFDNEGRIYIADSGNYRVSVFAADGSPVNKWGGKGRENGQFSDLSGIACHGDQVYVTDSRQDRVLRQSCERRKGLAMVLPSAKAPRMAARWEMDLSGGTTTSPRSEAAPLRVACIIPLPGPCSR